MIVVIVVALSKSKSVSQTSDQRRLLFAYVDAVVVSEDIFQTDQTTSSTDLKQFRDASIVFGRDFKVRHVQLIGTTLSVPLRYLSWQIALATDQHNMHIFRIDLLCIATKLGDCCLERCCVRTSQIEQNQSDIGSTIDRSITVVGETVTKLPNLQRTSETTDIDRSTKEINADSTTSMHSKPLQCKSFSQ